jgi:hypothetical protein
MPRWTAHGISARDAYSVTFNSDKVFGTHSRHSSNSANRNHAPFWRTPLPLGPCLGFRHTQQVIRRLCAYHLCKVDRDPGLSQRCTMTPTIEVHDAISFRDQP